MDLKRASIAARRLARGLRAMSRVPEPGAWKASPAVSSVGRHTYATGEPTFVRYPHDDATVSIGSFCSIGEGVAFVLAGGHRTDWATTHPLRLTFPVAGHVYDDYPPAKGDITVGHDVWIGYGATILAGVTIGQGAVIGARAVVAHDVRPYAIEVGNPSKALPCRRFDDETVDALLDLAWWDWSDEEIKARAPSLCSPDIAGLVGLVRA